MNVECEAEIELEQRERPEEGVAPRSCGRAASVGFRQSRTARPSLGQGPAGQSAGSPSRIHPPAAVAEYVIARKTIPLAKTLRDLALPGDRSMLRLRFQHVAPTRRGAPDWPALALVEDRAELRGLREAVAAAAEKGAITPRQAGALMGLVNTVMGMM